MSLGFHYKFVNSTETESGLRCSIAPMKGGEQIKPIAVGFIRIPNTVSSSSIFIVGTMWNSYLY